MTTTRLLGAVAFALVALLACSPTARRLVAIAWRCPPWKPTTARLWIGSR